MPVTQKVVPPPRLYDGKDVEYVLHFPAGGEYPVGEVNVRTCV